MENTKIICPSCNNEITDIAAFTRANYTCPHCKTFLKNNKDIAKACAPQSGKRASAVATKNFMGINIISEPTMPKAARQANNKEDNVRPKTEKSFNNAPRPEKQVTTSVKENMELFNDVDSSSTLSPELEALYDDDDYITASNEPYYDDNQNPQKDDDYFNPDDDDDDDSGFWGDDNDEDDDDDENNPQTVFTLAQIDDEEEDFSDSDIFGSNHAQINDEIEEQQDDIQKSTTQEPQYTINSQDDFSGVQNEEKTAINPNLDLFEDLNAVADTTIPTEPVTEDKPTTAPTGAIVNSEKNESNKSEEFEDDYYVPEEDDDDGYEDFESPDEEIDNSDDSEDDEQISLAVKLLRKAKDKKKNKTAVSDKNDNEDNNETNETINIIDINDDIGRKVKKSVFNSNKDHYYDDGKPFIEPEPDVLQPKTFLKVLGIFALLIGFTAYFIYMMP